MERQCTITVNPGGLVPKCAKGINLLGFRASDEQRGHLERVHDEIGLCSPAIIIEMGQTLLVRKRIRTINRIVQYPIPKPDILKPTDQISGQKHENPLVHVGDVLRDGPLSILALYIFIPVGVIVK